jgi:hypothetical protein
MEAQSIFRDDEANLWFVGELIAEDGSSPDRGSSYFSGSTGRWTLLKLWRTEAGKFVAQRIGRTQWQGEHDRYSAAVCDTEAEVIAFFGYGALAKSIYHDAGIEADERIE